LDRGPVLRAGRARAGEVGGPAGRERPGRGDGGHGGMISGTVDRLQTARLLLERLAPKHLPEERRLLLDPRVGATLWATPTPPADAELAGGLAAKVDH